MADLVVTATLLASTDGTRRRRVAGEAIAQGDVLYLKAGDGRHYKAKSSGDAEQARASAISFDTVAAAGQPIETVEGGRVKFGAAPLTVNVPYVLSANAGKICPQEDLVEGNHVTHVGDADDAAVMKLAFSATAALVPAPPEEP